jgi:hypothetical protein
MFLVHTPRDHAEVVARAVVAACRLDGWASPVQPRLLHTLFNRLLGQDLDFESLSPLGPAEVAAALGAQAERDELIQLMAVMETLCNPLPPRLERSVARWAEGFQVHERALTYVRELARGEMAKAVHDFYRLNWIGDLDRRSPEFQALLGRAGDKAYALTTEVNETEAARWRGLRGNPAGSIGRSLWDFYSLRGFKFPGEVGAVNGAVAQHDWLHVLGDYGTTPLGELEVLSFQSAATRTPGAMLGLVGAIALFDSGLMPASLIVRNQAVHALSTPGATDRMADAVARGAACRTDLLLDVDFFQHAREPLEAIRACFGIPPKSPGILALDPLGAMRLPPSPK